MESQELTETKTHFQEMLSETREQFQENNRINWVYKAPAKILFWEVGRFYQKPKDSNDDSDQPSVTNSGDEREDQTYTEPEYDQDHKSIMQF